MNNRDIITQYITVHDEQQISKNTHKRLCYLITCAHCEKLHWKEEHEIMRGIKNNSKFYCSRKCRDLASRKYLQINCANCQIVVTIKPAQIAKSKTGNFFCSKSCAAIFNNKKYPKKKKIEKTKIINLPALPKFNLIFKCIRCNDIINSNRQYCALCKKIITSENSKRTNQEKYITYIKSWQAGEISGARGEGAVSYHIRRYLFEIYENKCSECSWSIIHPVTGKIPLEIDHIDGNWKNNKEDNLRLLCPSCHALTPTYRSLNNGKGRVFRYKK